MSRARPALGVLLGLLLASSPAAAGEGEPTFSPWEVLRRTTRAADDEVLGLGLASYGTGLVDVGHLDAPGSERVGLAEEERAVSLGSRERLTVFLEEALADAPATWARGAAVALDVVVSIGGSEILAGTVTARPGQRAVLAEVASRRVLADYEVELACDNSGGLHPSAAGRPVTRDVFDGVVVALRPALLAPGGPVLVEVLLQQGSLKPLCRVPTGARFLGALDLPAYAGVLVFASGTASDGETLDLRFSHPRGEGSCRVTPRLGASSPSRAGGVAPADASALVLGPWRPQRAWAWQPEDDEEALRVGIFDDPPDVGPETLERWLLRASGGGIGVLLDVDGRAWVQGPAAASARALDALDDLAAARAPCRRVHLRVLEGDAVLAHLEAPCMPGGSLALRAGTEEAVVRDWDPEVG